MKIIFFGASAFSEHLLKALLAHNFDIRAVFTISESFTIRKDEQVKNYNHANLAPLAVSHDIPLYCVDGESLKMQDYTKIIEDIKPDIILVLGWYYMIPKTIRDIPAYGCCGIHASLLPDYAGWAPLVWAMIEGQEKTGVTFFKMDETVDGGDIIAQQEFAILEDDTIQEVYKKAMQASENILLDTLPRFSKISPIKQDKTKTKIYDKRSPDDGEINLEMNSRDLYNFIRAQSSPYPGAFIRTKDGKKLIIEKARIEE